MQFAVYSAINNKVANEVAKSGREGGFTIRAAVQFEPEQFLVLLNRGESDSFVLQKPGRGPLVVPRIHHAKEIGALLRVLVDEFLDTALSGSVETPSLRDLTKAPNVRKSIRRFSRANPIRLGIASDSISVEFPGGERNLSIGEMMMAIGNPREQPGDVADRYFGLLLLSGWHHKLAKCRRPGCGQYFWLKHWNRTYKRGIYCPGCTRTRSGVSALISTEKLRIAAVKELYGLVAQRFAKQIESNLDWYSERKLKAAITEYLNGKITSSEQLDAVYRNGGRQGITPKWLGWSKNRVGIKDAIKKGTHAKG